MVELQEQVKEQQELTENQQIDHHQMAHYLHLTQDEDELQMHRLLDLLQ